MHVQAIGGGVLLHRLLNRSRDPPTCSWFQKDDMQELWPRVQGKEENAIEWQGATERKNPGPHRSGRKSYREGLPAFSPTDNG